MMANKERIIRGYHIYKTVWKARIGEVLSCAREPTNAIDRYAVSVFKNSTVVGHLPKRISSTSCWNTERERTEWAR